MSFPKFDERCLKCTDYLLWSIIETIPFEIHMKCCRCDYMEIRNFEGEVIK